MVAVVAVDIGHEGEDILPVPGRPQVDDPPAPVPDVLQLLILHLRPLPLRPGQAVRDIADIVRDHHRGMLAGDGGLHADAQQLGRAHGRRPEIRGQMIRGLLRDRQAQAVIQQAAEAGEGLRAEDLRHHAEHLRHVVVRLPDEDDVLPRLDDHHEGDGHRQAGGLIGRPVGLQGVILRAQHHLPDPAAVEGREIGKADLDPDLLRRFQDPCQQIPGFTHSCVSSFSFSLARVSTAII